MSSLSQVQIKDTASMKDMLDAHRKDIFLSMNCHAIATIQSFDPSNQTCVAKINYDKTFFEPLPDGTYKAIMLPYPILLDVPVVCLRGGSSGMTFPISSGDQALILFNDRDINNWFEGQSSGAVASLRLHSMADGIALVGIGEKNSFIENYDPSNPHIFNTSTSFKVKATKFLLENQTDTLGELMGDLTGQLQDLITQISALTVTCSTPGNPSSIPINLAAFTAIGVQLATTATKLQGLLE